MSDHPPDDHGSPAHRTEQLDRPEHVDVPPVLRVAASWSWRLIVVGVVLYFLLITLARFQVVVVPLLVALLVVALIRPINEAFLTLPFRVPRSVAALLTMLLTVAVVAALISLISQQVATGFPALQDDAVDGLDELRSWLEEGPLNLSSAQLNDYVDQFQSTFEGNSDRLVSGALSVTSTAGHVVTGFFLVLFATYFFLSGGGTIWNWIVSLFPRRARARVDGAGARAWATITSFIRATLIVALVDGFGVGVAAALLGVPLAVPLGVLVFLGAFVPIVGALVSGFVAVLVAFVAQGPLVALAMLGAVVAVQQLEAHVLQPFLLGRAVQVHPLAVIVAIAVGVLLAGIVGALFAVPFIAVVNVVIRYLSGAEPDGDPPAGPPPDPIEDDGGTGPLADEPEPSAAS